MYGQPTQAQSPAVFCPSEEGFRLLVWLLIYRYLMSGASLSLEAACACGHASGSFRYLAHTDAK